MKITNKYDLPQALVNFAERDPYNRGAAHISVTEMIDSPRVVELRNAYNEKVEEDVADKLWALMGRALHHVCEQSATDINHIVEERIFYKHPKGWTMSGAIDVQEMLMEMTDGELLPVLEKDDNPIVDVYDYKLTSVYAIMNDKPQWEEQLNCYRYLIIKGKKRHVRKLYIVAILRDWRRGDAAKDPNYPQAPIVLVPIREWADQEMEDYVSGRLDLHAQARHDTFDAIPDCTRDEVWHGVDSYAVMRPGGTRALKVHDNETDCAADVEERNAKLKKGEPYEVVKRPGKRTRCEGDFCGVSQWCSTWQDILKERTANEPDPEAV